MEKTIAYSVNERRDLKNLESGAKLFYAQVQTRGVMDIREISERIHKECTVTKADTIAVLTALGDVVTEGLKCGEIVRLGDLCNLQIGLSSKGRKDKSSFSAGDITKARILFRPGKDLTGALSGLTYSKVPTRKEAKQAAGETQGA